MESKIRYAVIRKGDSLDDQKTPSQIQTGVATVVNQEQLQELFLSQMKRIIFDGTTGNWYLDFQSLGVKSLVELTVEAESARWNVPLTGMKDGMNRVFVAPNYFDPNRFTLYHNGRRLVGAVDYFLQESGGVGSGYDTVYMFSLIPVSRSQLYADYHVL